MGRYTASEYGNIRFYYSVDEHPVPADFSRHCHAHYEIIYVVNGAGKYVIEGERYELRPDTLMLFRPGEFHYVDVRPDARYERYVLHFSADRLPETADAVFRLCQKPFGQGNFFKVDALPLPVAAVFEKYLCLSNLPPEVALPLSRLLLSELLVVLAAADPVRGSIRKEEPLGARVIRYLNEHLSEPFSLEGLSNHFYVSKYYLCRAFKEHNGISILGYLNGKRVMMARQLIESGETAAVAAERVGFSDYSTFYRAYRKAYERSPAESRPGSKERQVREKQGMTDNREKEQAAK